MGDRTYETAIGRQLDGGLVCKAAEDHVLLERSETVSGETVE